MPCAVRSRRLATDVIGEVDYCGVDIDLDPYPPRLLPGTSVVTGLALKICRSRPRTNGSDCPFQIHFANNLIYCKPEFCQFWRLFFSKCLLSRASEAGAPILDDRAFQFRARVCARMSHHPWPPAQWHPVLSVICLQAVREALVLNAS